MDWFSTSTGILIFDTHCNKYCIGDTDDMESGHSPGTSGIEAGVGAGTDIGLPNVGSKDSLKSGPNTSGIEAGYGAGTDNGLPPQCWIEGLAADA